VITPAITPAITPMQTPEDPYLDYSSPIDSSQQSMPNIDLDEDERAFIEEIENRAKDHHFFVPDSYPIPEMNNPRTPPRDDDPPYPATQIRCGKKDWATLNNLKEKINQLVEVNVAFNEFIARKTSPHLSEKIDLSEFHIEEMQKRARTANEKLVVTQQHLHHVFIGDKPPRFSIGDRSGRVTTLLNHPLTRTNISTQYTAVVNFLNPAKCQTRRNKGICGKRHRTVYEFIEDHPEYSVHNVHISHLCHLASCFNPRHLIIEPSVVNFNRNRCRRECICDALPPCFEDSE